jgi:hypothetical protein
MKRSWKPGGALEQTLRTVPQRARYMVEARAITGQPDLRQRYDQWKNNPGLDAGEIGVTVEQTSDGGVRLKTNANANAALVDTTLSTYQIAKTDSGATSPYFGAVTPDGKRVLAALVEWNGNESPAIELTQVQAWLAPRFSTSVLPTVATWRLDLYAVVRAFNRTIAPFGLIAASTLLPLIPGGFPIPAGGSETPGWVIWDLTTLAARIHPKALPIINAPIGNIGPQFAVSKQVPYLLITITPLDGQSRPATNVGWGVDTAHPTAANLAGGTPSLLYGCELGWLPDSNPTNVGIQVEAARNLVPNLQLVFSSHSAATVGFTGSGNKLFVGQTPNANTELVLRADTPGGATVTATISDGTHTAPFTDGQAFGTLAPALTAQATGYAVQATLTPNSAGDRSPILRTLGMQQVATTDLSDIAEIASVAWEVDPTTHKGMIPQLVLHGLHDGARDFRDAITQLVSQNPIGNLTIRLSIGHPSMARSQWLHLDDFLIDDLDCQGAYLGVTGVGSLVLVRGVIPPLTPEVDSFPVADLQNPGAWTASSGTLLYPQLADTTVPVGWQVSTAYSLGAQIIDANNYLQTCTTAGTSGGSPPPWTKVTGGFTVDGTVTWQTQGYGINLGPNDATFIQSPVNPSNAAYRATLLPVGTPGSNLVPLVLLRAALVSGSSLSLTVTLYEGATSRAAKTFTVNSTNITPFSFVLTPAQIGAIGNWSNLRLDFSANGTGQVKVTWARLVIPGLRQNLQYPNSSVPTASPAAVADDILANQQAVDGRYRGTMRGVPGIDDTLAGVNFLTVSKTLTAPPGGSSDLGQAKAELDALAFIAGGFWTCEEGRIVYKPLYDVTVDAQGNVAYTPHLGEIAALIPMEEIKPQTIAPGFRFRVPEFFVPWGWNANPDGTPGTSQQYTGEAYGVSALALQYLGNARLDPVRRLDTVTAQWVNGPGVAGGSGGLGGLAGRHVASFGLGNMTWRLSTTYAHPELSLGDLVAFEQDHFACYDVINNRPIAGRQWVLGFVVGIYDVWGRELSLWIPSYSAILAPFGSGANGTNAGNRQGQAVNPASVTVSGYVGEAASATSAAGNDLTVFWAGSGPVQAVKIAVSTVSQPAMGTGTLYTGQAGLQQLVGPYAVGTVVYITVTPYADVAGTQPGVPDFVQKRLDTTGTSTPFNPQGSVIPTPADNMDFRAAMGGGTSGHMYLAFTWATNGLARKLYRPDGSSITLQSPGQSASGTSSGSNSSTTLNDTTKNFAVNTWAGASISITGGTGSGQIRIIASNTPTQITVASAWSVTPDATSNYALEASPPIPMAVPTLSQVAGGALGARTRFVRIAFVKGGLVYYPARLISGDGQASLAVSANNLLKVTSPTQPVGFNFDGWTPLVGSASNSEMTQPGLVTAPIAFGTDWTEPVGGATIVSTAATPYNDIDWLGAVILTELNASTAYYLYAFWDPVASTLRIAYGTGAVSAAAAAAQLGDGMYPLSTGSFSFTTPAAGGSNSGNAPTGGGTGGNVKVLM